MIEDFCSAILVWDMHPEDQEKSSLVISWSKYLGKENDNTFISLPSEVENHGELIRSRILKFIHETGMKTHQGKTIIEILQIRDTFSWWWMTLFASKRLPEDSNLYDLARIYALREILLDKKISKLIVLGMTKEIEQVIESLCLSLKIVFVAGKTDKFSKKTRLIGDQLPKLVQAALVLAWTVFKSDRKSQRKFNQKNGLVFFDYLNGLDLKQLQNGDNVSRYWGPVPKMYSSELEANSWFHVFTPSQETATPRIARKKIRQAASKTHDHHYLFSNSCGIFVMVESLLIFFKLARKSHKLSSKSDLFVDANFSIDFSGLFQKQWLDSLQGRSAMHSVILFCAMENLIRKFPKQRGAIYIMENQPWEIALNYAWRKFQKNKIVGIPQAAAKFWELRQFADHQSRSAVGLHRFPQPDLIGVNSDKMRNLLERNSVPSSSIYDLEASGYAHLATEHNSSNSHRMKKDQSFLVFGDYDLKQTVHLLNVASKFIERAIDHEVWVFRPHPMCLISSDILRNFGFITNSHSISEQLAACDLVIASSSTSAAVESYCLGIPTVVLLSIDTFNLSPLREMDRVFFAANENEFRSAVEDALLFGKTSPRPYFNLDPRFSRWRSLADELQ